jgi:hypothetical protein
MDTGIIALIIIIAAAIIILGIVCVYNIIDNIIEYFLNKNTTTNDNYSRHCLFDAGKWFIMLIVDCFIANIFVSLLKLKGLL